MTNPRRMMMAASGSGEAEPTPGQIWGAGYNSGGWLGDGTTTPRSSPVQFGSLSNWLQATGYKTTMAINEDGELWVTGLQGPGGMLGLGNLTTYSSPVQVGSDTDWQLISNHRTSTIAIRGGKLFCWGYNGTGSIGDGTTTAKCSPVQIGTATDWAYHIGAIGGNGLSHFAIKEDGGLWSWGKNQFGQLGHDHVSQRNSPVQVGYNVSTILYDWRTISEYFATVAVKTDGTLWSWGRNNYGQLGHGNLTSLSSPVQVGTLTDWAQAVSAGPTCAMIKTDGTLWTMGDNSKGVLGIGNLTSESSPVQVGSLTDWVKIGLGYFNATGYRSNGTIWSWGWSRNGCSGQGDTATRSSPVQIGSETTWVFLNSGYLHAIKKV